MELIVDGGVCVLQQSIQRNAFHQSRRDFATRIGRGLRTAHKDLRARIRAESFGAGQRVQ